MPGVNIKFETRSGPSNPAVPQSGSYFCGGLFDRGPAGTPIRCRSLAEVEATFGTRVTYGAAYDDLRVYFEEGGTEAWVQRLAGPAATKGFLLTPGAVAAPSVRVEAIGPGAWSTGVSVQVLAGTNASTVKYVIIGPAAIGTLTETFDNLVDAADVVAALAASAFVRATALGTIIPIVLAATPLSAGVDDRAAVDGTVAGNALANFGPDLGPGCVGLPGFDNTTVGAAGISHAKANRRIFLSTAALGTLDAAYLTQAAALRTTAGRHAVLVGPWVLVPLGGGKSKLVSPAGFAAAKRAVVHLNEGPWAVPAGEAGQARFVIGLEREVTRAAGDLLDVGNVSVIRRVAGSIRLYGWRSLDTDAENYYFASVQDLINTIAWAGELALERFVNKTIKGDGSTLASVATTIVGIIEPIKVAGGLYPLVVNGELLDGGYSVNVGPSVNTSAKLAANTIAVAAAIRPSPTGSLVEFTITRAGLTASV